MVDLLGPADAGSVNTLTTTSDVTSPVAGDTWFQDCPDGVSGTGTNEVAKYINRYLQQLRVAIRAANVPLGNSLDNMLSWAIQSGYANFIGVAGGSANALTGSVDNSPTAIPDGTIFCGYTTTPNTGPATFNLQTIGAMPVLQRDGTPLNGGEIKGIFAVLKYGSNWYLIDTPSAEFANIVKTYNPFFYEGVGAAIIILAPQPSGQNASTIYGDTFAFAADTQPSVTSLYGGAITVWDDRWPPAGSTLAAGIPGTWQVQSVSQLGFNTGTAVLTCIRIA